MTDLKEKVEIFKSNLGRIKDEIQRHQNEIKSLAESYLRIEGAIQMAQDIIDNTEPKAEPMAQDIIDNTEPKPKIEPKCQSQKKT